MVTTRLEGSGIRPVTRGPLEGEERSDPPILPSVVCIVDDAVVDRARLTRIAELGPDVGVHVLWVCDTKSELPGACRTFVDVGDGTRATVGMVRRGIQLAPLHCEAVEPTTASIIARTLAPLVDAGAPVDDVTDLPRSVPVVTLLGVDAVDDPDVIVNRWRENRSLVIRDGLGPRPLDRPSDLRAIVGHAGSEPFGLDLRKHGPHALVGGTTGAGKSEFLQAWVLGLAHAYSPDRVTFLFVDYKGGAAFAECVKLPHCVGLVTDLSPYLVRRVLRSLRAELRHRGHLLNAKGRTSSTWKSRAAQSARRVSSSSSMSSLPGREFRVRRRRRCRPARTVARLASHLGHAAAGRCHQGQFARQHQPPGGPAHGR